MLESNLISTIIWLHTGTPACLASSHYCWIASIPMHFVGLSPAYYGVLERHKDKNLTFSRFGVTRLKSAKFGLVFPLCSTLSRHRYVTAQQICSRQQIYKCNDRPISSQIWFNSVHGTLRPIFVKWGPWKKRVRKFAISTVTPLCIVRLC